MHATLAVFGVLALSGISRHDGRQIGGGGVNAYAIPSTSSSSSSRSLRTRQTVEQLSDDVLNLVAERCAETATGSWENGTRAQSLIEWHFPDMAVYQNNFLPVTSSMAVPTNAIAIAQNTMSRWTPADPMFVQDGSAGDPASLGVSILLANASLPDVDYMAAVNSQNRFLFEEAPRTSDGCLSHRVDQVQLWSDFVAMVPPYLAYYASMMQDDDAMLSAYNQIALYRQYLTNGTGLFRHIMLGTEENIDLGYWATGNAWAAWGMSRVLATMMHSPAYADRYSDLQSNLQDWIHATLVDSFAYLTPEGLLPNYLGEDTFPDASSTALMAAVSYRMAQLGLDGSTIPQADIARQAVFAHVNTTTGWLDPVVDPLDWGRQGSESPEGQSFTIILSAAYRDYLNSRT